MLHQSRAAPTTMPSAFSEERELRKSFNSVPFTGLYATFCPCCAICDVAEWSGDNKFLMCCCGNIVSPQPPVPLDLCSCLVSLDSKLSKADQCWLFSAHKAQPSPCGLSSAVTGLAVTLTPSCRYACCHVYFHFTSYQFAVLRCGIPALQRAQNPEHRGRVLQRFAVRVLLPGLHRLPGAERDQGAHRWRGGKQVRHQEGLHV